MDIKKNKYNIYLITAVLLLLANPVYGQQYGDFPYQRTLLLGVQGDMVFPATQKPATNPNKARFIKDLGLQLVPDTTYSFGAVFVDQRQFSSVVGIRIEFEYMMFGGTGGDGLCMFLYDASVSPTIGAHGAGIGYAYNRSYNGSKVIGGETIDFSTYRMKGLAGAYLGVALDEFGNYKGLRLQSDSRVNGIAYGGTFQGSTRGMKDASYNTQSQVTLRGAPGPAVAASGLGLGYTGYPVLVTQATNNTDTYLSNNNRPGFEINRSSGKYDLISKYTGELFPLNGGSVFSGPDDPGYRRAIIELFPAPRTIDDKSDGFLITVSIQHDQTTDIIIEDYHYKESFIYEENAIPSGSGGDDIADDLVRLDPPTRTLDASIPDFLRIGFAASTGAETNRHVIKNLKISLPRAAEANDDYADTNQGVPVNIMPLENDIAYDGEIRKIQEGKPEYLDVNTFRFRKMDDGSVIAGNTYTDENGNKWTFTYENTSSPMDRTVKVTMVPHPAFYGEAHIRYDIKGGRYTADPYQDDAYRSMAAAITVDVKKSPIVYRNTISNKMVTIKL